MSGPFQVKKAVRTRRPLKISLEGLSGSGKTYTALRLAFAMLRAGIGKRIAVADSENESASLYAGVTTDGQTWEYEVCPIPQDQQHPAGYAACYEFLVGSGFDLIIIDSMSHAWHGAMEMVDRLAAQQKGDKFRAWAQVTPAQRKMFSLITDPRAHLIATMRVKSEYERVQGANGRDQIRKVGLKTDQREGAEYEFDAVVRLDLGHEAHVEKVRGCSAMDGKSCVEPGPAFWQPLFDWWKSAADLPAPPPPARPGPAGGALAPTTDDLFALIQQLAAIENRPEADLIGELFRAMKVDAAALDDLTPSQVRAGCKAVRGRIDKARSADGGGTLPGTEGGPEPTNLDALKR